MHDVTGEPVELDNSPASAPLSSSENCLFVFLNLLIIIAGLGLPYVLCGSYVVEPLEATLVDAFGKIVHVEKNPGQHWYWPFFNTKSTVCLRQKTFTTKGYVPDALGSPLVVSANVTWSVDKPIEAKYHV